MLILGRGALARPDGAAVLAAAWQVAARHNMLRPDWHGFNLLHLFGGQVAPLELGFAAPPDLPQQGVPQALWLLGADGFDTARIPAEHLRHLPGPPRRGGGGAGRRDPARRGLHREGGDLGEHGGARAARPPRRVPAGRGARGLEDHPRGERGAGRASALRHARRRPRAPGRGQPDLRAAGPCGAPGLRRTSPGRRAIRRRCRTRRPSRCRSRITGRRTSISRASETMAECARVLLPRGRRRRGSRRSRRRWKASSPRRSASRPSPWRRPWRCWCRCCSPSPT